MQTNDAQENEVVVFGRSGGGTLERLNAYPTGGKGSGVPHLPSESSVVLADGHLFVTNAGSDDVTVFAAIGAELRLLDRVSSGGSTPRSIAVHGSRVHLLNTGDEPNIVGFTVEPAASSAGRSERRDRSLRSAQRTAFRSRLQG